MNAIPVNLQAIHARIAQYAATVGRNPDSIRLLAVAKMRPFSDILVAVQAGQRDFGENYVQEGVAKILAARAQLPDTPLIWHFIGPLQSNKTKPVAEHFDWVHSVDRVRIAERLAAQRPQNLPPLRVCVQVNVSGEASKSGVSLAEATELCRAVAALPRLELAGLMAIPAPADAFAEQRAPLARLARLREEIQTTTGLSLDTLSMGMSQDLEAAIVEGATLVRIGSAIFGDRKPITETVRSGNAAANLV